MPSPFRIAIAACGLAVLAAVALPGTAVAAKAKACPSDGTTIAQNASVRVYTKPKADDLSPVYACRFRDRKPFKLDAIKGPECQNARRIGQTVLAGDMIAIAITECELETAFDQLSVWNAKTRKRIRTAPAADILPAKTQNPGDGFTDLETIVLKSDGAVAWIGRGGYQSREETDNLQVRRITAKGKSEVLDSGASIAAKSLALAGDGRLYWANGTAIKSAT